MKKKSLIEIFFVFKACGGTRLTYTLKNNTLTYVNESGWSGSTGGFSKVFPRPSYQNRLHTNAYRGLPDLSANADPKTGYTVCFNKGCTITGG